MSANMQHGLAFFTCWVPSSRTLVGCGSIKYAVVFFSTCSAGVCGDQLRHKSMIQLMQRVQQQAMTKGAAADCTTATVYVGALLGGILRTIKLHLLAMIQVCLLHNNSV